MNKKTNIKISNQLKKTKSTYLHTTTYQSALSIRSITVIRIAIAAIAVTIPTVAALVYLEVVEHHTFDANTRLLQAFDRFSDLTQRSNVGFGNQKHSASHRGQYLGI